MYNNSHLSMTAYMYIHVPRWVGVFPHSLWVVVTRQFDYSSLMGLSQPKVEG